jgi:hypothetical protein
MPGWHWVAELIIHHGKQCMYRHFRICGIAMPQKRSDERCGGRVNILLRKRTRKALFLPWCCPTDYPILPRYLKKDYSFLFQHRFPAVAAGSQKQKVCSPLATTGPVSSVQMIPSGMLSIFFYCFALLKPLQDNNLQLRFQAGYYRLYK